MIDVTDNPYWEEVKDHARGSTFPWNGGLEVGAPDFEVMRTPKTAKTIQSFDRELWMHRHDFVARYSWTITDPESLKFVAGWAADGLIDPMAGTGYWAYVLGQMGVSVESYDQGPEFNHWHPGDERWVEIGPGDCEVTAALYPDRTLFLAWPPMNDAGARAVRAYRGGRVIYIGEPGGGCTGNDELHDLLETQWSEVACHRPVQWWGIHDYITVFERKA